MSSHVTVDRLQFTLTVTFHYLFPILTMGLALFVAWLKTEHALSHGHANHIAKRATEAAAPRSQDDPVAHLFEGGKEGMRPLYDAMVALVHRGFDIPLAGEAIIALQTCVATK